MAISTLDTVTVQAIQASIHRTGTFGPRKCNPYTDDEIQTIFSDVFNRQPGLYQSVVGDLGEKEVTVMVTEDRTPHLLLVHDELRDGYLGSGSSKWIQNAISLCSGEREAVAFSTGCGTADWIWLERCDSPYIVKAFGDVYCEERDGSYMLMEYCEGGSLGGAWAPDRETALQWIFDAIMGLAAIEALDLSHEDLRAANILIRNGRLKIADFGSASESYGRFKDSLDRRQLIATLRDDAKLLTKLDLAERAIIDNIFGKMLWAGSLAELGEEILEKFPTVI
jgi:serine/threonine protein kinase